MRERRDRPGGYFRPSVLLLGLFLTVLVVAVLMPVFLLTQPVRAQASVTIDMRDALSFEPGTLFFDPGTNVTLELVNGGVLRHTFTLFAEAGADVPVNDNAALQAFYASNPILVDVSLEGGQEATANLTVPEEGVYTFVCMVPGHAVGGMHGLMIVGSPPVPGGLGIGIVQVLFLIALAGVAVFAAVYHVRSTR
ncbi:MAG: cupredoxin domain-containing protein [Thermoplasmata archaeon]|nr:cupredoxin domain-containing protein [Thermoplasmata archaeon]